jgi:hypothetical protein
MKERLVQGALEALEYERGSGYRYILAYDYCRSERAGKASLIFVLVVEVPVLYNYLTTGHRGRNHPTVQSGTF